MNRIFLAAGLLIVLAGCASTPPVHYTLTPPAKSVSQSGNPSLPVGSTVKPYALTRVTVPAESDQSAIVARQEDGRMLVLEFDRWVASLSSHLQSAISVDMTSQLGIPPVQNLGNLSMDKSLTRIQLDVQRFDMVPGRHVTLSAVWRIQYAAPASTLICHADLQQTVDPGVSAMVVGQQKNVRQLSELMSRTMVTKGAVTGSTCSTI